MTTTTEYSLLPELFTPPLLNPAPGGLWYATTWTEVEVPRWQEAGMALEAAKVGNYSSDLSSGIWGAGWCTDPGSGDVQVKTGTRQDDPATYWGVTVFAYDECDMRPETRAEIQQRVLQVIRMRAPVAVAREFGERLAVDAGPPTPAADLVDALGEIECLFAAHNTLGVVHASPKLLCDLVSQMLVSRGGIGWVTPAGHSLVVDGGYRPVLGDATLVATSALFGWRNQVEVRAIPDPPANRFVAIAERSSLVACEQVLGAVAVVEGPV